VNRETAWNSMFITPTFELHQATTATYRRAYAAVARKYIAAYCPKTPIYVDTPEVVAGTGALGVAGWWTTSKGRTVTLHTQIRLRAHLPAAQLRHVALHECAHILQSRAVPANRYDQERQRQWKLYPTTAHEGQADCMAYYLVRDKRQLAYLKSCTAAQLVDAKRMWATYGRKYQAANYRWTV
jgi:hypothetical protein